MKYLLTLFICIFYTNAHAQEMEGVVTYERVYHWSKIYSRLDYLSQEEKDRIKLTWGNDDENKTKMKLVFSPYPKQVYVRK